MRDVMSSKGAICSVACFEDSLFVGEKDKVSVVDKEGRVATALTSVNGLNFNYVSGICVS
jgi:hypothetical protein